MSRSLPQNMHCGPVTPRKHSSSDKYSYSPSIDVVCAGICLSALSSLCAGPRCWCGNACVGGGGSAKLLLSEGEEGSGDEGGGGLNPRVEEEGEEGCWDESFSCGFSPVSCNVGGSWNSLDDILLGSVVRRLGAH